ncbi:MAG: 3-phosphoshikimate 1-carboxyvinyltransferase, partial [Clostridia bacterium]|nr:3-phosphoshikimate 1-carboxyvinyltransferase [Clostridia bacterium]
MDIRLKPAPLRGELAAPPSKSHAQRLLLCAALADGETRGLLRPPFSHDIAACLRALPALGAQARETADEVTVVPR